MLHAYVRRFDVTVTVGSFFFGTKRPLNVVDDGWGGKADSQSISRGDLLLMSINVFQI